jgi:DNA-binding CsgD family transcriptional regulator
MTQEILPPTEIDHEKPLKTTKKIHHETLNHINNLNTVKGLVIANKTNKEIADITGLHRKTVTKLKREIVARDLSVGNTPLIAKRALDKRLKEGNMQAVKMVYDRVHPVVNRMEVKTQKVPYEEVPEFDYEPS